MGARRKKNMKHMENLLRMVKEPDFLDVFEDMEEEQFSFEDMPFYQVEPRYGIVCEYIRMREGMYGGLMDVKIVALGNLDTKEEDTKDETVTLPLSRANLRRGVEALGVLTPGDKIAIVNLGKTKIKSGRWKGKDCFDYRVKKLD